MTLMNAYYHYSSLIIPPLGFVFNFILIWLILQRTPIEMWFHSRVLLQTCILDIILLILFIFGMPYCFFIEDKFLIIFDGYLLVTNFTKLNNHNPIAQWNFFYYFWYSLYNFDVFSIAVQFLYRYLSLNRNIPINFGRYLSFLSFPFIINFFTSLILGNLSMPNPLTNTNASEIVKLSGLPIDFNKVTIYALLQLNGLTLKIAHIIFALYYLICYSIIIFCGRQMIQFIATHAMSERLKKLNNQLTTNLIIYASYPLIFHAALILLFLTNIFNSLGNAGLISCLVHWLPVLNPLTSLWTFRPYRDALIGPIIRSARILPI